MKHITAAERTAWNGKAAAVHSHDDRYYTQGQTDTKLSDLSARMEAVKAVLLTIPAGRVAGDVNGDGKFDDTDVAKVRSLSLIHI